MDCEFTEYPKLLQQTVRGCAEKEIGVEVADSALQVLGGHGFVKDFPSEKYYHDMKLCTIGGGTSEIQRLVIAREILKSL